MTVSTPNDHLVQARANRGHAEWLLVARPDDPIVLQWAITAAFYSALHGLTGHLLRCGVVVASHATRAKALTDPRNGVPQSVYLEYRVLEDESKRARYLLKTFTVQDVRNRKRSGPPSREVTAGAA